MPNAPQSMRGAPHRTVVARAEWAPLAAAHAARADAATADHRYRVSRGKRHPVADFLYDYYAVRPSRLRRWHPGPGIVLEDATDHAGWTFYRTSDDGTEVDLNAFLAARGETVTFVRDLLAATAARPAHAGCFGMHEWAMVYRQDPSERRHTLPLRLGPAGTDAVVERHPLTCTHFDAFRFFTPEARPRNAMALTRAGQVANDQPGCLHANMDLYKWAAKLSPAIPSDLQMDAFELAVEVREADMRASPYDVAGFGLEAIAVETPAGKREYADLQREFAARAAPLRQRLIAACDAFLAT